MQRMRMSPALVAALMGGLAFAPGVTIGLSKPAIVTEAPRPQATQRRRRKREFYRGAWWLNRSRHWKPAKSYAHARAISPFPDRPVR